MLSFKSYITEKHLVKGLTAAAIAATVGATMVGNNNKASKEDFKKENKAYVMPPKPAVMPPDIDQTEAPKEKTYHEKFHDNLRLTHAKEYDTIMDGAKGNGIPDNDYENLSVLFSIRKSENGAAGKEFGVLHPKAGKQAGDTPEQTLRRQAGWSAATIMKNRARHATDTKAGKTKDDFITYLGNRYAPKGVANDPNNLNKNWITNVGTHYKGYIGCENGNCAK